MKTLLAELQTNRRDRIESALGEAAEDATVENPDKDQIGSAVERALGYASKAADFTEKSGKIAETIIKVVGWLGKSWDKLLPLVGLSSS